MHDPYAPPSHSVHQSGPTEFSVVGDLIHSQSPLVLPGHICARCGSEETGGKVVDNKKVYWTPSWVWVTILVTWILTIILHYILRKPLVTTYYMCPQCAGLKKKRLMFSGVAMVVGFVLFIGGFGMPDDIAVFPIFGGMIMGIIGMIALFVFASPLLQPKTYDKQTMTFSIRGAKPGGLEALAQHTRRPPTDGAVW